MSAIETIPHAVSSAPNDCSEIVANAAGDEMLIDLIRKAQNDAAQPLTILLVEDDPEDTQIFRAAFAKAPGPQFEFEHVDSLRLALRRLRLGGIQLVLLDLCLPDANGLEVVTLVHAAAPHVPIVVHTGLQDDELALAAILAGAQDYVVKREMDTNLIVRSLRFARERHLVGQSLRMKSAELALANQKLEALNRQKDEFLSRISHELRTPLTAIYQFTTIMADGLTGETTPDQRESLAVVLRNVKEIRNMVGELLEATRAEAGRLHVQPRRVSIAQLVDETLMTHRALALNKGIAVLAHVAADLPPAYADPQRVRQILTNLIDNAVKFTPQNGSIWLNAGVFADDPRFLCVSVEDSGEGLRPEVRHRVFERLYQDERASESRQGLGLGLYICRQLVTCLGGRIWVDSRPGEGSRFSFTLPVFSLPGLLVPILAPGGRLVGAAALVRIEIVAKKRTLVSKAALQRALQHCRLILATPSLAHLAVLPEMSGEAPPALLAIAVVHPNESHLLVERLRQELGTDFSRRFIGLEPQISFAALHLQVDPGEPLEASLRRIAAQIEGAPRADSQNTKDAELTASKG